jgi:DNA-binding FadR family transcriptional regulator
VAATKNDVLLRFINVFYLMSRKRREVYFHDSQQSKRSHAQHLQLYRAIVERDAELGQKILRRHLKGVDAYFRMFFADEQSAIKRAQRNGKAANIVVARVPRGATGKLPARR